MKHPLPASAMCIATVASLLFAAPAVQSQTVETSHMVCESQNRPAGKSFVSDISEVRHVTTHVEDWNSHEFRKVVSTLSGMPKESLYTDCIRFTSYQAAYTYRERAKTVNAREGMPATEVSYVPKNQPGY